jgi:hypothetical protein
MVLGIRLFLGLGAVSLWSLVEFAKLGMVLVPWIHLGTIMGVMEDMGRFLRMGSFASIGFWFRFFVRLRLLAIKLFHICELQQLL